MTSLAELAATARDFGALERRLFEVLGASVPAVPDPEAKVLLRSHSFQHAWHAELWDGIAPRTGPEAGTAGLAAELVTVLEKVARDATASTVERLTAAYEVVLPRLAAAYQDLRDAATPASDGPLVRALGLMLADDEAALAASRLVLLRAVGTPATEAAVTGAADPAATGGA